MASTAVFQLAIPGAAAGLPLAAQLIAWDGNVTWTDSGAPITVGFYEAISPDGTGFYLFPVSIPDAFVGGVRFYNTADSTIYGVTGLVPLAFGLSATDSVVVMILGLLGLNMVETDVVYDGSGQRSSWNWYTYPQGQTGGHVSPGGGPGVINKFSAVRTFDANSKVSKVVVTKVF